MRCPSFKNGWQPLSTAPKSQEVDVLLAYKRSLGHGEYDEVYAVGIGHRCGEYDDGEPMFKVEGGIESSVTAWMPLPKHPDLDDGDIY